MCIGNENSNTNLEIIDILNTNKFNYLGVLKNGTILDVDNLIIKIGNQIVIACVIFTSIVEIITLQY